MGAPEAMGPPNRAATSRGRLEEPLPSETSLCQRLQEEPKEQGFFSKSTKP